MKRRILALVLTLAMLLPCLMGTADAATSGKCGANATWEFDADTGTLTISGKGAMYSMMKYGGSNSDFPWYPLKDSVKAVIIEDGITSISDAAFSNMANALSVSIADSVTKIGGGAFSAWGSIKNITIPDSVKSIGASAFAGCQSLESIDLGNSITKISNLMFDCCSSLKTIKIPDSVTTIEASAFWRLESLETVTIPKNVSSIALPVFAECYALKEINVDKNNKYYSSVDGVMFDKDQKTLVRFPHASVGHYSIPDTVENISRSAFYGSKKIESITIPDSVTEIDAFAFGMCTGLTSIAIPSSLNVLSASIFNYCNSLETVILPDSITEIGDYAFNCCEKLTDVYYEGTKTQRSEIAVGENNGYFENATWHYGYSTTPVLKCSADTASGKPKLSWSEIVGAEKYRIYRATSKSGTYSYLATSTGTSYIDTDAVAGTNYYYKVKALDTDTDTYSEYSNIVNRVCDLAKPTVSLSVNTSTGKPVVKWETVEGAAKYYVYRSTSKSSGYEKVYTAVSARTYTDTDAVAGTNYYYKVMAIHEVSAANSAYSKVVNRVCDLAKPTITLTRTDAGNPWVKWKAIEDADGYEVWRSTSKSGTYKKVKTTVSATSFADRDVTEGTKYYYKVRAIHDTTAANSAYSAIKYITAK